MSTTPLTDAITALTTYSNTVTGASDTTLSSAVATLAAGYGQGGDNLSQIMKGLGKLAFENVTAPEKLYFPNVTWIGERCFRNTNGLEILVLPSWSSAGTYPLADSPNIQTLDLGIDVPNFGTWYFSNDSSLTTIIIRKTSGIVTLGGTNSFSGTPFASGGAGGTIYVPSALISTYQSASNWSTIHGYGTITWQAIEGSQYENYYADGTAIS